MIARKLRIGFISTLEEVLRTLPNFCGNTLYVFVTWKIDLEKLDSMAYAFCQQVCILLFKIIIVQPFTDFAMI